MLTNGKRFIHTESLSTNDRDEKIHPRKAYLNKLHALVNFRHDLSSLIRSDETLWLYEILDFSYIFFSSRIRFSYHLQVSVLSRDDC